MGRCTNGIQHGDCIPSRGPEPSSRCLSRLPINPSQAAMQVERKPPSEGTGEGPKEVT